MQGSSVVVPFPERKPEVGVAAGSPPEADKGLKSNALGMLSSIVIGVASTAPAYSLAVTLGLVTAVAGIGLKSPAIMLVSFVPMILIAASYYYLNKADPDCGTTFSWVTRAIGPRTGWVTGWVMVAADIIVMASLAQITGTYFFLLIGANGLANSLFWVTFVGVAFLIIMCVVTAIGIEISARLQWFLLGFEYLMLIVFSVVALTKVYVSHPAGVRPPGSLVVRAQHEPRGAVRRRAARPVHLLGLGHGGIGQRGDRAQVASCPGIAAILSTVALVFIYVLATTAAQAFHGPAYLANNSADVLSPLGNAVLGSGLNQAAHRRRADLRHGLHADHHPAWSPHHPLDGGAPGHPQLLAKVNPRFQTPVWGTADLRRPLARLVCRPDPAQPERAGRLDRRPRHGDRLLLRHQRLRGAAVLPPPRVRELEEGRAAARLPAGRAAIADLGAARLARPALVPGQLGLRHLLVRHRAAVHHRRGLHPRRASSACSSSICSPSAREPFFARKMETVDAMVPWEDKPEELLAAGSDSSPQKAA